MASNGCVLAVSFLPLVFFIALASDQNPIQDFCVADTGSTGIVWYLYLFLVLFFPCLTYLFELLIRQIELEKVQESN